MVNNPNNLDALRLAITNGNEIGHFLPSVYVLEPTNRCNVNCIMCPQSRFKESELGDSDEAFFIRTLDQIAPYAELTMLYFLGESTLHPRFATLIKQARKRLRGKIVVSTNAFDLSDETIAALIENTDIVLVCIDRWSQHSYEKIRRGSSFASVVLSAEKILQARGRSISPTVLIKSLDISFNEDSPELLSHETQEFCKYWAQRGAVPLVGWLNTWAGQLGNLKKIAVQKTPYTDKARTPCADLWFKMIVNWKGQVILCCHDWSSSIVLGNLRDTDLMSVWHSDKLVQLRRSHLSGDFRCTTLCHNCSEWGEAVELESYVRLNASDLYQVF